MAPTQSDDRRLGVAVLLGLLSLGTAAYTLIASYRSVVTTSEPMAAALQGEAAVAFAASITLGALLVAALHVYQ